MTMIQVLADLTPLGWVKLCGVIFSTFFIYRFFYNALFHPLSKVPGPFLAGASGLPSWYYAMRGDRHIWLLKLFETYGSKIRVAPNTVVFRDSAAYKDIYAHKANVQKAPFYEAWQKDKHDVNTFTTREKSEHAHARKLLNQCFNEKSLLASQSFMTKHVDRWNELMIAGVDDGEWSEPMDFTELTDGLVFDIMGDLCFGADFNLKEPGENPLKSIPHAVIKYMKFYYPLTRSPMLNTILWLKPRGLDNLMKAIAPPDIQHYINFVESCVTDRLQLYNEQILGAEDQQRKDMFWFLCDTKDDAGKPAYNTDQLNAEANTLIVGATDTTSTSMAGMMFYLTRYPDKLEKLVNELRSKFPTPEDIVHGPVLTSCVYLRACIDETMRLSPAGPGELPREVRKGGATIDGDFYPAGTIVGSSNWTTGHNEAIYGDTTEVFYPERWIPNPSTGVTQEDVKLARANFNPFATGPGSCPGKNLAILELSMTIGRTLHRLEIRKPLTGNNTLGEGDPANAWGKREKNVFQVEDAYVAVRHGPMLQFKKRAS
ncbi:hypothetical protein HYALB_00009759 [Hymenoscyphus albidus]|uniref:Benzoate 4-monooxygenase cytochrome P450 n=1 Tax=Hymenoscyphus albidus TaxID=595503 RepID=A0A9N9Q3P7_9HELO|nr:hypothetical protein HYALB_00009759 [Hymenoscyphus albidus]